jgi:phosphoribosylglycinamide formyltransferase 1
VFINVHVGITPRYRGVHGGFWAIYENRPELAGVTVHKIDPGVDTGAIIAQTTVNVDPRADTFRTLPVKQYLAALPLMRDAVGAALDGTLATMTRDDLQSQQWYSPTFADYLVYLRHLHAMHRAL